MDSRILKKGDELGSIYDKPNRKGRKDYSIDYRVKGVRKRERVGFSKREAQEALESRLTDIRRQRFEGVFPEPSYTLEDIYQQYLWAEGQLRFRL